MCKGYLRSAHIRPEVGVFGLGHLWGHRGIDQSEAEFGATNPRWRPHLIFGLRCQLKWLQDLRTGVDTFPLAGTPGTKLG